jgi:hypothetical protein
MSTSLKAPIDNVHTTPQDTEPSPDPNSPIKFEALTVVIFWPGSDAKKEKNNHRGIPQVFIESCDGSLDPELGRRTESKSNTRQEKNIECE